MRTIISSNIHNIIDFDRKLIDTAVAERCVAIAAYREMEHIRPENQKPYKDQYLTDI